MFFFSSKIKSDSFFVQFQVDLRDMVSVWNTHRIRPSRHGQTFGRPVVLFQNKNLCNLQFVNQNHITTWSRFCEFTAVGANGVDSDIDKLANMLMEEKTWDMPLDYLDAVRLYRKLRNEMNNLL